MAGRIAGAPAPPSGKLRSFDWWISRGRWVLEMKMVGLDRVFVLIDSWNESNP